MESEDPEQELEADVRQTPGSPRRPGTPYIDLPRTKIEHGRSRRRVAVVLGLLLAASAGWLGTMTFLPRTDPHDRTLLLSPDDRDAQLNEGLRSALRSGSQLPVPHALDPTVLEEIADGERDLYSIRLVDTDTQDGDMVTVFVDERPLMHVRLSHAGSTLHLPIRRSGTTTLRFEARQDGGGGVTFGAWSSRGHATTRVLAVGESETWTVAVSP